MDELDRLAEEGPQVEVFAVRSLHTVIVDAGIAVELWPRVDALGAVGGVQHMRYPQIHQPGLVLGCEPVNTRGCCFQLCKCCCGGTCSTGSSDLQIGYLSPPLARHSTCLRQQFLSRINILQLM